MDTKISPSSLHDLASSWKLFGMHGWQTKSHLDDTRHSPIPRDLAWGSTALPWLAGHGRHLGLRKTAVFLRWGRPSVVVSARIPIFYLLVDASKLRVRTDFSARAEAEMIRIASHSLMARFCFDNIKLDGCMGEGREKFKLENSIDECSFVSSVRKHSCATNGLLLWLHFTLNPF